MTPMTFATSTRDPRWLVNAALFWRQRRLLWRIAVVAFVISSATALLLPKSYRSTSRILPPQQTTGSAAMLAALSGRAGAAGGLASLAGGLLGGHSTGALYISLLRSGTVAGRLMERFELQHVYRKRYLEDTARKLDQRTSITEDVKSGIITVIVEDHDRQRARDLNANYISELNALVAQVNTSSAHREREFIEQRLVTVRRDLQKAQLNLSDFSTQHATLDIKEQTRATVDASARLEGQRVLAQGELESLRQIYGPENVRVHAAEARIGTLDRELQRASGDSDAVSDSRQSFPFPPMRQLPARAVTWANLYREVRVQETVFEMLAAQYETARIEEAKSIPSVNIIDPPSLPEKKSGPHRLWIVLISTVGSIIVATLYLIAADSWSALDPLDNRRLILSRIAGALPFRPATSWRRS